MSKIAISCAAPTDSLLAATILHEEIGYSFSSARDRIKKGKKGFFFTTELYLNDHVEKERVIRTLIKRFNSIGVELFIAEIGYLESWADIDNIDTARIPSEDLIAELDLSDGKFR